MQLESTEDGETLLINTRDNALTLIVDPKANAHLYGGGFGVAIEEVPALLRQIADGIEQSVHTNPPS